MWNLKRPGVVLSGIVRLMLVAIFVAGCSASQPAPTMTTTVDTSQEPSVILTVAVPSFMNGNFTNGLIHAFESDHPGVKVSLVKVDASIPPAAAGLDKHLTAVQQYVGVADVLYVASTPYLNNA